MRMADRNTNIFVLFVVFEDLCLSLEALNALIQRRSICKVVSSIFSSGKRAAGDDGAECTTSDRSRHLSRVPWQFHE